MRIWIWNLKSITVAIIHPKFDHELEYQKRSLCFCAIFVLIYEKIWMHQRSSSPAIHIFPPAEADVQGSNPGLEGVCGSNPGLEAVSVHIEKIIR